MFLVFSFVFYLGGILVCLFVCLFVCYLGGHPEKSEVIIDGVAVVILVVDNLGDVHPHLIYIVVWKPVFHINPHHVCLAVVPVIVLTQEHLLSSYNVNFGFRSRTRSSGYDQMKNSGI